jgi:hypothetical protein
MGTKVQYLEIAFPQISDTGSIHTTSNRPESKKTTKVVHTNSIKQFI